MDEREREHIRDSLVALRELARSLVDDTMPTFEAAEAMWSTAFTGGRGGRDGDHCHALWLLWGALTDWIDYRPEAGPEIEAAMRRAASQWLEVADDELRWRPYFDHWLYKEFGYERPSPQTVYVEFLDEGVDEWRPVEADVVDAGESTFRLPLQAPPCERWRFAPGSVVRSEWRMLTGGCVQMAVSLAE